MKLNDFIYDPSLQFYVPLYELDGSKFQSKDAIGHLCTNNGSAWRLYGRYFITDDYIDCGSSLFNGYSGATIEVWIRSSQSANAHVFSRNDGTKEYVQIYVRAATSNWEVAFRTTADTTGTPAIGSITNISNSSWHHLVGTWDGRIISAYLDGILQNTVALTGVLYSNDVATYLGARANAGGVDVFYTGDIGEARIYNRALTPQEVLFNFIHTRERYA